GRYGPLVDKQDYLRGCADSIARLLAEHGWEVARPLTDADFIEAKPRVQRLVYRRDASGEIEVTEESVSRAS
ncbi:MAG: hypothetical protein ACREMY_18545, partial [bacterium]